MILENTILIKTEASIKKPIEVDTSHSSKKLKLLLTFVEQRNMQGPKLLSLKVKYVFLVFEINYLGLKFLKTILSPTLQTCLGFFNLDLHILTFQFRDSLALYVCYSFQMQAFEINGKSPSFLDPSSCPSSNQLQ